MLVKNIVLVHGAFADGTSWSKIIPLLEAEGYSVVAVQNPLTSLADDVAATKRIIALQDGPVLLVGHSWGGAVITQAGDDPKVAGLVYVAAYAPEVGQSAMLPPAMEESAAKKMNAMTTTLPTCHMVILEEPAKVAAVIDEAAKTALTE